MEDVIEFKDKMHITPCKMNERELYYIMKGLCEEIGETGKEIFQLRIKRTTVKNDKKKKEIEERIIELDGIKAHMILEFEGAKNELESRGFEILLL